MNPLVLSGMVAGGLLKKKDRILCCHGTEGTTLSWLRRRRYKVEELAINSGRLSPPQFNQSLYDIVLTETEISADKNNGLLREAIRFVRPGGCLFISPVEFAPFGTATHEATLKYLAAVFSGENITKLSALPDFGTTSGMLYRIRKGGAYAPKLPVKYIDSTPAFNEACNRLVTEKFIGLDVETTLNEPRILCTIQMATESLVYLIDALPLKDLTPFKRVMENPDVLKIIHNKDFEAAVLGRYEIQIHNIYDTLVESRKRHKKNQKLTGHRLSDVCERELGLFLDKSSQTSDWTNRPLTQEQRDYAAADAEVLIRLYQVFQPPPPPTTGELF